MRAHLTLPNLITLSRILLIIPIGFCLQKEQHTIAFFLAVLAFLTDYFDGKIARRINSTSNTGAILDPIADKILTITLMSFFFLQGTLNPLYFTLSTCREIAQLLAIPVLLQWKKIPFKVKPKLIPKTATALKFLVLGIFFLSPITPVLSSSLPPLLLFSGILETYILVTFSKRFTQIYTLQHDTFE